MTVFMWLYALLSPFGGFVADKFNRRWMVIGSLFVWPAVTYLTGQIHTYNGMLICRALMGVSEACYLPAALALITERAGEGQTLYVPPCSSTHGTSTTRADGCRPRLVWTGSQMKSASER
ncbi:MAG: MFS transporter [Verrucomicrobiota bacterium]